MKQYSKGIDGLRTVAVGLVVLFHAGYSFLANGFVGVDVFFTLSGFLVTNVLLQEYETTGDLNLQKFFAKRARRLLPPAVVTLVGTSLVFYFFGSSVLLETHLSDARAAFLYHANFQQIWASSNYFSSEAGESPFIHFWSLSIEEQFYFAFPLVMLLLIKTGVFSLKRAAAIFLALAGVSLALQFTAPDGTTAYFSTFTRAYQILAGVILALFQRGKTAPKQSWLGYLSLAGLALLSTSLIPMSVSTRGVVAVALSVAMLGNFSFPKLLEAAPVVYLGKISYGIYLWHWPVIILLKQKGVESPTALFAAAALGGTTLAALSYHTIENYFRHARLFPARRTLVAGLALSVAGFLAVGTSQTALAADNALITGGEVAAESTDDAFLPEFDLATPDVPAPDVPAPSSSSAPDSSTTPAADPAPTYDPATQDLDLESEATPAIEDRDISAYVTAPANGTPPSEEPEEEEAAPLEETTTTTAAPTEQPADVTTTSTAAPTTTTTTTTAPTTTTPPPPTIPPTAAGGEAHHPCTLDINRCLANVGNSGTAVVIGDSHVGVTAPLFQRWAQESDLTLYQHSQGSCSWAPGLTHTGISQPKIQRCAELQYQYRVDLIDAVQPDIIVLHARIYDSHPRVHTVDANGASIGKTPQQLVAEAVQFYSTKAPRVIVVGSLPVVEGPDTPPVCLSLGRDDCDFAETIYPSNTAAQQAAAALGNVNYTTWTPLVCPDGNCSAVIDGIPVRRDGNHLSDAMVSHITPAAIGILNAAR